jgi:hypothetical protein
MLMLLEVERHSSPQRSKHGQWQMSKMSKTTKGSVFSVIEASSLAQIRPTYDTNWATVIQLSLATEEQVSDDCATIQ